MDENEDRKDETAATLFSVLSGLALVLLLGWLLSRGCTPRVAPGASTEPSQPAQLTDESTSTQPETEAETETDKDETEEKDDDTAAETPSDSSTEKGKADDGAPGPDAGEKIDAPKDEDSSSKSGESADNSDVTRRLELATQNRDLRRQIESLEKQASELKAKYEDYDSLAGERDAMKLKLADADKTAAGLQEQVKSLNEKVKSLESSLKQEAQSSSKSKAQGSPPTNSLAAKGGGKMKGKGAQPGPEKGKAKSNAKAANQLATVTSERDDLQKKLAAANAAAATAKTELASNKTNLAKAEASSVNLQKRITDLEKKLEGLGKEKITMNKSIGQLKADAAANAKKMTAAATSSDQKIKSLQDENKKLSGEIATLKEEAGKMGAKVAADAQKMTAGKTDEIARLNGVIAKMGDDSKARITALTAQNNALRADLDKLKEAAGKMSAGQAKADDLAKLSAQNKQLGSQLAKANQKIDELGRELMVSKNAENLKAAIEVPGLELPHLVSNPAKLNNRVLPLFARLRGIEDSPAARTKTYEAIGKAGTATPVKVVKFDSGSSQVSDEDKSALKKLLEGPNANASYLVVGYASTDGDPESNARLSSKRASRVAQEMIAAGGKANQIEAVYFGQTDRFSDTHSAPNRVVEVWRVK